MVATVGSIAIDLVTNALKFAQGFKSAATTVDRESSRMAKAVDGVSKASKAASGIVSGFVGGIVAGGVLAGLTSLTGALGKARDAIGELDEIATRSRAAGITSDSYQALAFAAKQANVEQDTFNKSLEIFTKNVGQAENGYGALYNGLAKLNPELLENVINAKDQRERLGLVADALKNARSETEKAALATAVFGKSGAALIPILEGGASSLDRMEQQAKELGIVFDKDLVAKAGQLDDQLDTLSTVLDVQFKSALLNLAPVLSGTAELLANFATGVNSLTKAVNEFAANPSLDAFEKIRQQLITIDTIPGSLADDVRQAFAGTAGSAEELRKQIAAVEQEIGKAIQSVRELEAAGAVDFDITGARDNLRSLEAQLDTLRAKLSERIKYDIDTAPAKAKLDALISAAKAAAGAMGRALATAGLKDAGGGSQTVRGGGVRTFGPLVNENVNGSGVRVTSFVNSAGGQDRLSLRNQEILSDIKNSIEDGSDAQSEGFDSVSSATSNSGNYVGSQVNSSSARLGGVVDTSTRNQTSTLLGGLDRLGSLWKTGSGTSAGGNTGSGGSGNTLGGTLSDQLGSSFGGRSYTNTTLEAKLRERFGVNAGKFAEGGSFIVPGGSPAGDKNLVSLMANSGERVTVEKAGTKPPIIINYTPPEGEGLQTSQQRIRLFLETAQRAQERA